MIRVFNIKDIIKSIIKIIILLCIIYVVISWTLNGVHANRNNYEIDKSMTEIIKDNIGLTDVSKDEGEVKKWGKAIINSEFEIIDNINKIDNNNFNNNTIIEENEEKDEADTSNEIIEEAKVNEEVKTEIIPNEVQPRYNVEYDGVQINNSTEYSLTEDMMNPIDISINKGKAIIYHTHTCESYTPTEENYYEMNGNYRTTDLEFSVSRVGDELEKQLKLFNWDIIHDKSYHDYPSYNGSYSRSLNTARNIINNNEDVDIVIDLHRDAIADSDYDPKVKIGDEVVSQLMFVIGTDIAIPEHKNWNQNLKFAIKVQEKANELYPGLFKPIILRNSAYNQYLAKGACIIEVGATGNTLEESNGAMKYLARILNEV